MMGLQGFREQHTPSRVKSLTTHQPHHSTIPNAALDVPENYSSQWFHGRLTERPLYLGQLL